ncbi:MAG: MATE family efflux transporter [Christensenellaceae bacterium]|nr:MATE family efflux transporter [Christensenellaceae bacterium]
MMHLKLKDFNVFDRNNELNLIRTPDGDLSLFRLFFPIFIEMLLSHFMNTANVYIMGRVSDDAVASIGVATQILTLVQFIYVVIGIGVTVVINQNLGAGNTKRAVNAVSTAIYLSFGLAVVVGIAVSVFATPLIRLMQLEEKLIPDAAVFLRITAGISVFSSILTVAMAVSRAYGNTLFPVIVSLLMNVLNAIGSYVVVLRPFEMPFDSISGMAFARVASQLIACIIMMMLLKRVRPDIRILNKEGLDGSLMKDVLNIGIPSGVQSFSYSISQTISTAILAVLGAAAISSKIYVTNIVFYSYILGYSFGQANGLMVGRLVGQKEFDRAYRMTMRNLTVTLVLNAVFSIIIYMFRYQLMGTFTSDKAIIDLGVSVMAIDILVEIGRGMNHTFQSTLISTGDSKFPTIVMICTTWGLSVLFSYLLGVCAGMGLMGCWISFALDEVVRGCLQLMRWRSGKWRSKSIVKEEAPQN